MEENKRKGETENCLHERNTTSQFAFKIFFVTTVENRTSLVRQSLKRFIRIKKYDLYRTEKQVRL